MTQDDFNSLMHDVATKIGTRPLNAELGAFLNATFPHDGSVVKKIQTACKTGIAEGWLCENENRGIHYSRPIKPSLGDHDFSVDVVVMDDCRGPHHAHPGGEIDLILPEDSDAEFDDHGKGWLVYEPGSAHYPTVTGGKAVVLYLLPNGAIEFTRAKKD